MFKRSINKSLIPSVPVQQVNACGIIPAPEVLVDLFREMGAERCKERSEPAHNVVYRLVGMPLVNRFTLGPHAGTDKLDVPAGEIFQDKVHQFTGCPVELAFFHRCIDRYSD